MYIYTHSLVRLNNSQLHREHHKAIKFTVNLPSSFVTGSRGRRVPGVGQQVLPGSRRRGRSQHHAGHLHQELLRRHQSHHTADAVPQQGSCEKKIVLVTCRAKIFYPCRPTS